jgi:glycine dehydrogenase
MSKINLNSTDLFTSRHIGPNAKETKKMLAAMNLDSIDTLIAETVPASIRRDGDLNIPAALSEFQYLNELRQTAAQNKVFRSYIGLGYYNTITPAVIRRNVLENPGWYTQYTPYQAEIAQGRLEAILNFQTMICDLTAMPIANASLLDEGTAAFEPVITATISMISFTCVVSSIAILI